MEWVMVWLNKGYWMTLRDENDRIVAKYLDANDGFYRVEFMNSKIDDKTEYIRVTDMNWHELQTYIRNKYLLLRGET